MHQHDAAFMSMCTVQAKVAAHALKNEYLKLRRRARRLRKQRSRLRSELRARKNSTLALLRKTEARVVHEANATRGLVQRSMKQHDKALAELSQIRASKLAADEAVRSASFATAAAKAAYEQVAGNNAAMLEKYKAELSKKREKYVASQQRIIGENSKKIVAAGSSADTLSDQSRAVDIEQRDVTAKTVRSALTLNVYFLHF